MFRNHNKERTPHFLECTSVEAANNVDLDIYRFERYSESKGAYIFVRRANK